MHEHISICACTGVIFFIIGLSTYLCGCDHRIQANCYRFRANDIQIIDYQIDTYQCTECVAYTEQCGEVCSGTGSQRTCNYECSTFCSQTNDYPCYTTYAIGLYSMDASNHTCTISVDDRMRDHDNALNDLHSAYTIGLLYRMYIEKATYRCMTKSTVQTIAMVGFVFLIITAIIVCCTVGMIACYCCSLKHVTQKLSTPVDNVDAMIELSVEPISVVEPSVEPSVELSVEPFVEPFVEPLVEPSVEPFVELIPAWE
jgi:hypothetical protein